MRTTTSEPEYADPANVTAVRVYEEEHAGSGGNFAVDGIDNAGHYTEACWTFDTEAAAIEAVDEFRRLHHINPAATVTVIR